MDPPQPPPRARTDGSAWYCSVRTARGIAIRRRRWYHAMPPGGFRPVIVNAHTLVAGQAGRARLAAALLPGAGGGTIGAYAPGSTAGGLETATRPVRREGLLKPETQNGNKSNCNTLRRADGSHYSCSGFPVLQKPTLGTANSEYRNCLGVRSFLLQIPEESMKT